MRKYLYGTKIQMSSYTDRYKFYTVYGQYRQLHLIREEGNGKIEDIRCIDTEDLLEGKFEIIEDEQEIDIQSIVEPLKIETYECDKTDIRINREKIKELVQAVKQLDKKIDKI